MRDGSDGFDGAVNRRDLLASAALAVPAALTPRVLSGQQRRSPADAIRVGIIGAGGIVGSTHIPGSSSLVLGRTQWFATGCSWPF